MYLRIPSLFQNICSRLPQALTFTYQKTTEAIEKVADSVFSQASQLPLGNTACFPVGLAAFSFRGLYFGGAAVSFRWVALGVSALATDILFLKGAINKSGAISQLDKAINALEQALKDLADPKKNPKQIKEELKSVFGEDALTLPDERLPLAYAIKGNGENLLKKREMLRIGPWAMAAIGVGAYFLGRYRPD